MSLQVGFIGSGWVAGQHRQALENIAEARIVAIVDTDEERAAEAAAQIPGAGAYTDHERMLDDCQLDAVWVCVPPHAHGDIEMALIDRGLPFFLEKPLANDLETARRVLERLEGTDLMVAVGYMMRYHANVERVKDFLASHQPIMARASYQCGVPPPAWWRRKEQSGGQIVEQSTHIYDLARYLFGEVSSLFCQSRSGLVEGDEHYTVDDASICNMKFDNGVLCEVSSSCALQMESQIGIEIFTPEARLELSGWPCGLTIETDGGLQTWKAAGGTFEREDRAFVNALLGGGGDPVRSTYADAFETHRVTCSAEESIRTGQPVQLR